MPLDHSSPRPMRPGDIVRIELPYSEVCMHMRVAGTVMDVRMTGGRHPMAQLLDRSGSDFSAPILPGEAGIYGDLERGFHYYPHRQAPPAMPRAIDLDPLGNEP